MADKVHSKGKILVVEDKGIVAKDIARSVKSTGYALTGTCMSPADAFQSIEKEKPDIVLMDIRLNSEMDGIETAAVIKQRYGIPTVFITAYTDEETLERARKTNPYGYIIKPFDDKVLEIVLGLAFERIAVEKDLSEKDAIYRLLVENSQGIVWALDRNMDPIYVSPSVKEIWGYSVEEIKKMPWEKIIAPGSIESMKKLTADMFKGKGGDIGSGETDLELIRKNGSKFWGRIFFKPIINDKGEVTQIHGSIVDVTQRLEALSEIKSQRDNFLAILEKYPEAVYVSDPDTYEILFVNEKLKNLMRSDVVGKKCHEAFNNKAEPCEFCTNEIIRKTNMPHVWENYNAYLQRHFLNTDQMITWHDGRQVRFETAIDVSDQKKIEALLQASEKKYRSFIEQSSYGFFILNMNQEITYLNREARKIYGISEKDTISITLSKLLEPGEYEKAMRNIMDIAKGKDVVRPGIYTVKRSDGVIKIVEIQTFPVWKDEKLVEFHGTVVDITEKVNAENQLREKSEFLDAIINNSSDGIFVVNEDIRYVLINPASGRILGHDPEEWVGKKAGTFKHPEDEKNTAEAFMKAMGGEPSSSEVRVMAKDGKYHLLEIRYNQMILNDNYHVLGMVTDITERRKAEQSLIASEDKYRSLFENSPEAIIILGREGKIIECNRATVSLMEKKIEEIIGRRIDELGVLDSAQAELFSKIFMAMTKGKEINKREMELIMNDGRSKWIEVVPSMIAIAGEFYGIQLIAQDITDRKLADIELRKKLLKFDIDYGNIYLSKESSAGVSLEAFKELLMVGNEGLLISRKSRKEFQNHIDYMFNHVKVSETDKENHVKPDYKAIRQLVSNIPRGHVIHIDCIEYLISWIGANKTLILVQYLKDLAMAKGLVVLISIDPNAISEKELRLIEKECVEFLPQQSLTKLSQKFLDIIRYIDDMNREGRLPSYSDISEYFELSKPTARSRIRQLIEMDTVKEIQRGRMKILELTENGKNYLVV